MLEWLFYQVPWWVWLMLALIVVGVLHQTIGLRNALVGAVIAAAAVFHIRSRQQGWKDREKAVAERGQEAIKQHQEIENEARSLDEDELDRRNDPWIRR